MKKLSLLAGIFLIISITIVNIYHSLFLKPIITMDTGYVYFLKPGLTKKALLNDLAVRNIIKHPQILAFFVYFKKNQQLKAGEYLFPKGANFKSIWLQVTQGKGLFFHAFTIVPGWSFDQLRLALSKEINLKHTLEKFKNDEVIFYLSQKKISPEGEFFPDTYYYTRDVSDLTILKMAYNAMQIKLHDEWVKHTADLPYKNEYELLIAASLIEKEAYLDTERPIISGVIANRLKKNMLLQIDPTVIYGLGERYTGKILKTDLMDNNPYNTYMRSGLPPTPIAFPSLSSIKAAVSPQKHEFLYFVAKPDKSHQFSKTLIEHHLAVNAVNKKNFFNQQKINNYVQQYIKQKLIGVDNDTR